MAKQVLQGRDGSSRFRKAYGDYFVCGYELGSNAGATLSATTKSSDTKETLSLTVKVKALFIEKEVASVSTSTMSSSSAATMTFNGYSTLDEKQTTMRTESLSLAEQEKLQALASSYLLKVGALDHHTREKLVSLGFRDGQVLSLAECTSLCQSGLVVQLMFEPFARLGDFISSAGRPEVEDTSLA